MYHLFMFDREEFAAHYHKRSNVEAAFSAIKGKFGGHVRAKSDEGQVNEVLAKVLCHNICVLGRAVDELGIEPILGPSDLFGSIRRLNETAFFRDFLVQRQGEKRIGMASQSERAGAPEDPGFRRGAPKGASGATRGPPGCGPPCRRGAGSSPRPKPPRSPPGSRRGRPLRAAAT
jgi:hypothetical protein